MKSEEQMMFIMKIIQRQRMKFPNVTEMEILMKTNGICKDLIESGDLDESTVEGVLSIVFKKELETIAKSKRDAENKKRMESMHKHTIDSDPCYRSSGGRSPC